MLCSEENCIRMEVIGCEESDIIIIDEYPSKKSRNKNRKKGLCKKRIKKMIMCQKFSNHRRRENKEIKRTKLNKIRNIYINNDKPIERIVPCCLRGHCDRIKDNITQRCVKHERTKKKHKHRRRKCKLNVTKRINSSVNDNFYESISSDSFHSDSGYEMDELIRSTRKRMQEQYQDWSIPIYHASTPLEDLDSTFELDSIHSSETVVLNKVDDLYSTTNITGDYSISSISLQNIKVENNNNNYEDISYSPSMPVEDLNIDIKPLVLNNYDNQWSPISDDYLPIIKQET